ncbi:hydantoinase/oxoprolinase family protein [Herbiconiux sp. CPCC 203407]|uniref:Hydantoinase/oxoprolinase family protein n=1 Tax=Herbiconiux oxytropis TaxID=2970915 RepID=A0AA41XJZ7_9MICO|nr:hydantoinase/oxoprolinase family protein [Herbiconiux oxytropis]MCS5722722.1 hydantoinase/oxoprolinase family protein [Herbiconiux oxytropis]MCS5728025.1 hydantoinase/oxoprolinase family protein [Herbiconiux oxytropis]
MTARLGIDVGGTFTDVVVFEESGRTVVEKVPSTPHDASIGILNGIEQIKRTRGVDVSALSVFAHGSTVATNALLESKLPRTALVVTKGFRDMLEIGTQMRPDLFNLAAPKVKPYVPRELVFEAAERVDRLGGVVTPLSDESIASVVESVKASGVEAVGIALLFSFRNAEHEQRIADALREAIPGLSVAISSAVAPEIKEYQRASTTVVSAALQPLVARYMAGILDGLHDVGVTAPMFVMQSNGGTMTAEEASVNAHRMVLSGPAAGVLAATRVAEQPEYADLITFDMGGTSTDIALIAEGRAALERETEFEGRPLLVPQFAIHTIGSGGGSLARVDESGALRVGPESAGAVPGPACYGRGGTRPTTTDAQLVLGRIDPKRFLGGEMDLDIDAAREAIRVHVAEPLGMELAEAAAGILEVADAVMARGARVVSVNRGHDPRDFHLLPFGGAGPMHALSVGAIVDVAGVIVPLNPGTFSAVGLSGSDVKYDFFTLVDVGMESTSAAEVEAICAGLIVQAEERLASAGVQSTTHLRVARFRYAWQDNDVEVVIGDAPIDDAALEDAVARFHERHLFEFGHSDASEKVELYSIGIEAVGTLQRPETGTAGAAPAASASPDSSRPVYFRETGWNDTPVYERENLAPGAVFQGPAIVEEREATTVVTPNVSGVVDPGGNLVLTYNKEVSA